jgi:formyltetrahydrofolate synthetase
MESGEPDQTRCSMCVVTHLLAGLDAGFLYPICWVTICGDIMTIPGLPTRPEFYDVNIDTTTGEVIGLF